MRRGWYNVEHWIDDYTIGERLTLTVSEDEQKPEETGLFDHHGNKLYRNDKKARIGFRWRDE